MLSPKSRFRLRQRDPGTLVFHTSPLRRVVFGLVALVLVGAVVVGGDWSGGIPEGPVVGLVLFSLLLLGSLGVAGYESRTVVAARDGAVRFRSSILMIPLRDRTERLDDLVSVVLRQVKLMDERHFARRGRMLGAMMERRAALYRLYLELGEELMMLEESADRAELERAGQRIADFAGLPYRFEQV